MSDVRNDDGPVLGLFARMTAHSSDASSLDVQRSGTLGSARRMPS